MEKFIWGSLSLIVGFLLKVIWDIITPKNNVPKEEIIICPLNQEGYFIQMKDLKEQISNVKSKQIADHEDYIRETSKQTNLLKQILDTQKDANGYLISIAKSLNGNNKR